MIQSRVGNVDPFLCWHSIHHTGHHPSHFTKNLQGNRGIETTFENESQDSEGAPERGLDLRIIVDFPWYRTITAPKRRVGGSNRTSSLSHCGNRVFKGYI